MVVEIKDVDRDFYAAHLADFLPAQIVDVHTHVWLHSFALDTPPDLRLAQWPAHVAADNAIEELQATYRLMLPRQHVTPVLFGWPERTIDTAKTNAYTGQVAHQHGFPGLLVSRPEWPAAQLEQAVAQHGLLGLKPYLSFAPLDMRSADITIYDFLPHEHLEVADAHGWIVMLHIPRPGRLKDPVNLAQLLEIEHRYPRVRLIVAHIGRAYCDEDIGNAFDRLKETERMCFDFSANTNAEVMAQLLAAVGPRRVLFGSDLPISRMRLRRICEGGTYINLVPTGLYGDVSDDPHMREVPDPGGAGRITFFMYEQLLAFRQAAEAAHLDAADVAGVFAHNAQRLIEGARLAESHPA
jgi:predicted TIM-barrel fold metal-dependent hydrolase